MARIEQSIDVNVPLSAAYNQWTQFEQFPRFMDGVREVRQLDDVHLHWRGQRHGREIEWDSEIVEQVPDQCINWRDTSGPQHSGSITFEPLRPDQTRVRMTMDFESATSDPEASGADEISERLGQDLERFKHLVEMQGRESGAWRGEIHGAHSTGGATAHNSAGAGRTSETAHASGDSIGKTVGQTPREQQEGGSSAHPSGRWEAWTDESAFGFGGQEDAGRAGSGASSRSGSASGNGGRSAGGGGAAGGAQGSSRTGQERAAGGEKSGAGQWFRSQFPGLEEPMGMMRRMTEEMDQLFERFVGRPIAARFGQGQGGMAGKWMPQIEVMQSDDALLVCVDLPGVKREDVQIALLHDRLTLEGERHEQSTGRSPEGYRRSERSYGRFYRMIPLPHGVDPDNATASMRDGVLEIRIPMPLEARQARTVDIQPPH